MILSLGIFYCRKLIEILINQVDQPDLGLPLSMYLDLDSYADYIAAYKTYMVDTARVMVRELGTAVPDEQLAMVSNYFVRPFLNCSRVSLSDHQYSICHRLQINIMKDSNGRGNRHASLSRN